MSFRKPKMDTSALKDVKVTLPIRHHIALHQVRLVSDDTISETVRKAVELYFEKTRGITFTEDGEAIRPGQADEGDEDE